MKTRAFIFSAPSGSGKTTIVHHLLKKIAGLQFSVSATTRSARLNEQDTKDYHFLSSEEFDQKLRENAFLEWEEVYEGVRYGTLKSEVERVWSEGNAVVFDIDVKGGVNIKRQLGEEALAIFIRPPDLSMLRKRLENRKTESPDSLEKRIGKAQEELEYEKYFDITLVNDDLSRALDKAETIVNEALAK